MIYSSSFFFLTPQDKAPLLHLWYHESCRVFRDRLVCDEDRDWFNSLLKDCIQEFNCNFYEVVPCQPVLYGDFMNPGADTKVYTVIEDKEKVSGGRPSSCLVVAGCFIPPVGLSAPTYTWIHLIPHAVVQLVKEMEEYMEDYNQTNTAKMKLVLFMDAIEHVCRISRILRQPQGNALLLGVGGSGRQSVTKLASYM